VVKFYKRFYSLKVKAQRAEEKGLRDMVEECTRGIHKDPDNKDLKKKATDAGEQFKVTEQRKAEGRRIRSQVKWKRVGDSCSQEFFKASENFSNALNLTEVVNDQGVFHVDQQGLEWTCAEFY